ANKIFEFKKILFANKPIQDSFIKLHPQAEKKSYLLNYVIDDKRIINLSKANIEVNKPDHKVLFITAGSLNDRAKNYTLMIKMMSGLTKLNNHVELWILGDGPDLVNLKMLVNSLNLNNYVKFLGFKGNPYPYMAVADYFVNTSDYFDFSTALSEARVLQKPIISTNIDEVNNNTYIISSDPNKIVSDVNELLNKKITYQGNNNFWVENQRILKTLDTIITTK
ncbi:MAG: glycosyltransferase, partial [Bacilli bacterium]|nr:glycosyltransferase [Bacilli bacterium]